MLMRVLLLLCRCNIILHVRVLGCLEVCLLHKWIHNASGDLRHCWLRRCGRQRCPALLLVEIVVGRWSRHHGWRRRSGLLVVVLLNPTPFLLELGSQKVNSPPSLLLDFLKDGENLLLFFRNDETLRGNGQTTQCHAGHAPRASQSIFSKQYYDAYLSFT